MNRCLFPVLAAILLLTNLKTGAGNDRVRPGADESRGRGYDHDGLPETGVRFQTRGRRRRWSRLIYNLKVVYPIALEANATLHAMEQRMDSMKTKREKQEFVKAMERALKRKYTPVLKNMTLSQGNADQTDRPGDRPDLLRPGQNNCAADSAHFLASIAPVRREPERHL